MEWLDHDIRRQVAPNPSPMTGAGTCSYVLGTGSVAVIDPGPADRGHLRALIDGLAPGERVGAILVTHAHLDHSEGARMLAEATGARIHAFGDASAGRSQVMARLAAQGFVGGGEGVDHGFAPDVSLEDGESLAGTDWEVVALHTPGHFGNHLSFASGARIFTGDVVMGWSTTLISPPDGDLSDYLGTLDRLARTGARMFYPGHGDPLSTPEARLRELGDHRRLRSRQILSVLGGGAMSLEAIVDAVYAGLSEQLKAAAARNVFAHLIDLHEKGEIQTDRGLSVSACFSLL